MAAPSSRSRSLTSSPSAPAASSTPPAITAPATITGARGVEPGHLAPLGQRLSAARRAVIASISARDEPEAVHPGGVVARRGGWRPGSSSSPATPTGLGGDPARAGVHAAGHGRLARRAGARRCRGVAGQVRAPCGAPSRSAGSPPRRARRARPGPARCCPLRCPSPGPARAPSDARRAPRRRGPPPPGRSARAAAPRGGGAPPPPRVAVRGIAHGGWCPRAGPVGPKASRRARSSARHSSRRPRASSAMVPSWAAPRRSPIDRGPRARPRGPARETPSHRKRRTELEPMSTTPSGARRHLPR